MPVMAKGGGECLKIVSEGLLVFFLMVVPRMVVGNGAAKG